MADVEKVARAIPDEAVEAACTAYWENYRNAWRPYGLLTATQDVPFAKLMPNVRKLTAAAMRDALEAALAAMGEREAKPVAWMRDWAAKGIDVKSMPLDDRPPGGTYQSVTQDKLFETDVPLYASPRPEAVVEAVRLGPIAHRICDMMEAAGQPRPNGDIMHDVLDRAMREAAAIRSGETP